MIKSLHASNYGPLLSAALYSTLRERSGRRQPPVERALVYSYGSTRASRSLLTSLLLSECVVLLLSPLSSQPTIFFYPVSFCSILLRYCLSPHVLDVST